jgi:hypothetical protein
MKKTFTILLVILISILAKSQDPIIQGLDSSDPLVRQKTLAKIEEDSLYEYVPALEERIFNQPAPFLEWEYLLLLEHLKSTNLESIALHFIEIADEFETQFPYKDPLESKVLATRILISLGNYSTIDYIFEIVDRDKPEINQDAFSSLIAILNDIPEYEEYAKQELLYVTVNNANDFNRFYALKILNAKYGNELIDDYIDYFENSPNLTVRMLGLDLLYKNNYANLQNLLIEHLPLESDWSFRCSIFALILKEFGEPSDLKAVMDYQPNEPNETARSLMSTTIDEFFPPRPASLNWQGMITRLVSYTSEMYTYGWIANAQTRDYYISTLNLLSSQLERGFYTKACATLNVNLLARIEQDLQNNNITTEGYKFLHYYCVYIKEEFPGLLPCL